MSVLGQETTALSQRMAPSIQSARSIQPRRQSAPAVCSRCGRWAS